MKKTKRFRDGDVLRCYKKYVIRRGIKARKIFNCEYEKSGKTGLGLVFSLPNFLFVDTSAASGDRTDYDEFKGFKFEFDSLISCQETKHECKITLDRYEQGVSMYCHSWCEFPELNLEGDYPISDDFGDQFQFEPIDIELSQRI